jgi:hypothetical protein
VIVSPASMYEYTKRSIAMLGATGILNECLSAWIAGVICIGLLWYKLLDGAG